jgi:hypothetical protein
VNFDHHMADQEVCPTTGLRAPFREAALLISRWGRSPDLPFLS